MNFYDRYILPHLIDLALRNKHVTRCRSQIIPRAHGTVLEIGVGSGLNLPFYGDAVERVIGVDPSQALLEMARSKTRRARFDIELLGASAEALPLEDRSVDAAVTTFTLCSLNRPLAALRDVRRVLKPGGLIFFAEHGLAPEASVARWQHLLNRPWRAVAGGCNLNRNIPALIESSGFEIAALERAYMQGPRILSYIYSGHARRC